MFCEWKELVHLGYEERRRVEERSDERLVIEGGWICDA